MVPEPDFRRVATIESVQASLRDAMFGAAPGPWVKTHGYDRLSLRDETSNL
jgi:hypothetical protein